MALTKLLEALAIYDDIIRISLQGFQLELLELKCMKIQGNQIGKSANTIKANEYVSSKYTYGWNVRSELRFTIRKTGALCKFKQRRHERNWCEISPDTACVKRYFRLLSITLLTVETP